MCTTKKCNFPLFTKTQCNTTTLAVETTSNLQTALSFFLTDMISVQNNVPARIKQYKDE